MAKKWYQMGREEEDEGGATALPKEIQEQLDEVKGLKSQVSELTSKLSGLDDITGYIRSQREESEARRRQAPVKTQDETQAEREELAALLLSDPEAAYAKMAAKTNAGVMQVAANLAKREVFEDNADRYPYYTGEVKAEINKILSKQTLQFQTNHEALENTYYTVVGKMQKDIQEGKIKDRFASASGARGSQIASEEADRKKITPNDDILKISKQLGMNVDEYVKLLEEDVEKYV
jgi:hypothetical protein